MADINELLLRIVNLNPEIAKSNFDRLIDRVNYNKLGPDKTFFYSVWATWMK